MPRLKIAVFNIQPHKTKPGNGITNIRSTKSLFEVLSHLSQALFEYNIVPNLCNICVATLLESIQFLKIFYLINIFHAIQQIRDDLIFYLAIAGLS